MQELLAGLRAAAEPTRLRLLALLARNELTVSELTQILGMSQPRISRHLKLLTEAGLIDRYQEGTWVFYRLANASAGGRIAHIIVGLIGEDRELERDQQRLGQVRQTHADLATDFFEQNAAQWDRIRSLQVSELQVEQAMLDIVLESLAEDHGSFETHLDLGTGTGRVLELFAPHVRSSMGIDLSAQMLLIARARLELAGLSHCQVRRGDIFNLIAPPATVDLVTLHQVLHYLNDPAQAIIEAARLTKPGGHLLIVDFAPHTLEFLRDEQAHRRLGFSESEVASWCRESNFTMSGVRHLHPEGSDSGGKLTVSLWLAVKQPAAAERPVLEEVQ